MFIFDHLLDVFVLLVLALLIFGPKRLIAMGSDFGRAARQFREATKNISWTDLLSGNLAEEEAPRPNTPPATSFTQTPPTPPASTPATGSATAAPTPASVIQVAPDAQVVDATLADVALPADQEPPRAI